MRLFVKYPKGLVEEPILSTLVLETKTKLNVLRANMDGRIGEMIIDIEYEKVKEVVDFLRKRGVEVKEIHKGITLDRDRCIDCGACISICPTNALYLEDFSVKLDESKCGLCRRCVDDCPVRALKIKFDF
ncbi:MAG: hypothetical protein A7315_11020 [Candidatus Altiarchaeales archaeon WOR_SM1_79]|nr:MAG: hypothetical protein A7315_11020 [Candidatus Altiarchaeales archaeon WOR_SM1_79]